MSENIVRIAARGDGVTASGRHVAFGVPGDTLLDDGQLIEGPGHQAPPCRHFPACGGCQLQHLTDEAYAAYCVSRVSGALAQHGLQTEVRAALLSPPRTRRRTTLRAMRLGNGVTIGFNEAGSNRIVDLKECHVLHPALFDLIFPLRHLLRTILPPRRTAEVHMTLADQGVDLLLKGVEIVGLEAAEALTTFGMTQRLSRISVDEGYGAETRYEPVPASVTLGAVAVAFPPGAFLQATADGEAALIAGIREAVGDADQIADLFAGLGTFAFALEGRVMAAEASRDAIVSLKAAAARAGRAVQAEHRDLYRRPYDPAELQQFDAVVLDPPRSGAAEQVKALATSNVARVAYVSCNPATFARDAETLVNGGYRLSWVRPVGQFRWSTHVELVAAFTR